MDPPFGNGFRQQQIDAQTVISRWPHRSSMSNSKPQQQKQQSTTTTSATGEGYALRWRRLHAATCVRDMSVLVCLVAIVALGHSGWLIPPATANAQRENTRVLPLHTGGLADGGRIGFGADSSDSSSIAAFNVPCPTGMFRCNDGKCITSLWVCNYQKDCEGGEDEQQSCPPPECEAGQISCGQYVFNMTYCTPPHYRCDMTEDCDDKSDEAQCKTQQLIQNFN